MKDDKRKRKCQRGRGNVLAQRLDEEMGHRQKHAENGSSPASKTEAQIVQRLIDMTRAILDRSAAYRWPVVQKNLAGGRPIELTHRGQRIFLQYKKEFRHEIDARAVAVELAKNEDLFHSDKEKDEKSDKEGLTIAEAAKMLNIDRGLLSKHLVEIPLGEPPFVPPGKVPCRRIGNTKRIFRQDLFGAVRRTKNDCAHETATPVSADRPNWHRSLSDVFDS